MNIYEKLQTIQTELKAPKNQYNAFGKYKYRSCEDIQEGVKPLLSKTKTSLVVGDEIVVVGERYYIKATAKLFDCESEERISNIAYAREEESKKGMDGSQVTGASSSYARKYALNGLFCIDDTKDSDSTNATENGYKKAPPQAKAPVQSKEPTEQEMNENQAKISKQKIGQAKINTIKSELERTGVSEKAILTRYKMAKLEDITEELFTKVMSALKNSKSKENK
jgi:hypothetical protein